MHDDDFPPMPMDSGWFNLPVARTNLPNGAHLSFDMRWIGRRVLLEARDIKQEAYLFAVSELQWKSENGTRYHLNSTTQKVDLFSLTQTRSGALNLHNGELEIPGVFLSERTDVPVNE